MITGAIIGMIVAAAFLLGRFAERHEQAAAARRAKLEQMARARTQCTHSLN